MFKKSAIQLTLIAASIALTACGKQQEKAASYEAAAPAAAAPASSAPSAAETGNQYAKIIDNTAARVTEQPVSTFSLDVDTGSYANTRRFLNDGQRPPVDAVRVEEMMNYFPADASAPMGEPMSGAPFAVSYEIAKSPWADNKAILRLNVQAQDSATAALPPSHLVFLVDVSGSMDEPNKLPLVKKSLKALVERLRDNDKISLVTYSGETEVVLNPTSGNQKDKIIKAIDRLGAGGGTAGGEGLKLAYDMAKDGYIKGGVNRILMMTDGDFNVGVSDVDDLKKMVEKQRDGGVTLSTIGFGSDNLNDEMMEKIADVGNGNYSYIDSEKESQKVLDDEMRSTLLTVAKDVKAQIEFNPNKVLEYRQIGYENRQLAREDFNNDKVDAGDIGAGKSVTVLYALVLKDGKGDVKADPLRYQTETAVKTDTGNELAFLKMRWKKPADTKSELTSLGIHAPTALPAFANASVDLRFTTAVAAFGQKLRDNPVVSKVSWQMILDWANNAKGQDAHGYRQEFVGMVRTAKNLN